MMTKQEEIRTRIKKAKGTSLYCENQTHGMVELALELLLEIKELLMKGKDGN